jgi:hypothetical protein
MNNMKLLLFSVVYYIVWLFFFRSCVSFNEESFQKYMTFHQGTFIGLCESNYENLQPEAKTECDRYFEAKATQREAEQQEERKKAQEELSYESRL